MASRAGRMRRPSRTRVVTYSVEGPFAESVVQPVLEAAQRSGIVTAFDTGRGALAWFQGPPGGPLRALRRRVVILVQSVAP